MDISDSSEIKIINRIAQLGYQVETSVDVGLSLEDIHELYEYPENSTAMVRREGVVEWEKVPRERWSSTYPIPGPEPNYMFVTPLQGGGNNIFAIAAAAVLTVIAGPLAGFLVGSLGSTAVAITTAAIIAGGNLLIGKLFAPEPEQQQQVEADVGDSATYKEISSDSNRLARDAFLPIVVDRRVKPPEVCNPRFYLELGQQNIDRLFGLEGEHLRSDIQVDGTPISDFDAITVEEIAGAEQDVNTTSINVISALSQVSGDLLGFSVDDESLEDQVNPGRSSPVAIRFTTPNHKRLEEINFRIRLNGFFNTSVAATKKVRSPLRIRVRPFGGDANDWVNVPEAHIVSRFTTSQLIEIRMRWDNLFGPISTGGEVKYEFRNKVPASSGATYNETLDSSGRQWTANNHFIISDTDELNVQNISIRRDGLQILMDETVLAKGRLEWEIVRGITLLDDDFNLFSYGFDTSTTDYLDNMNLPDISPNNDDYVLNLFDAWDDDATWKVIYKQGDFSATGAVLTATTIAGVNPVQRGGVSLLALNAKDQSVESVTHYASKYFLDWNGTDAWDVKTTSTNPATIYYNLLRDFLVHHGVDETLIDSDRFVQWRQECIDRGYRCSIIVAGESLDETLAIVASAGYARPAFDHGFSIQWFRDQSSERPICAISPRNTTDIRVVVNDVELPSTIRVNYVDENENYESKTEPINNSISSNYSGETSKTIRGLVNLADIRKRETFDLLQSYYRNRLYIADMDVEHMGFQLGDLVLVVSELFGQGAIGAVVKQVIDPMTIVLDQELDSQDANEFFSVANVFDETDLFATYDKSVLFVTKPDGTQMIDVAYVDGATVRLQSPLESIDIEDSHVTLGQLGNFAKRCLVAGIDPTSDLTASVILIDEAPEIYTTMQEKF